jgi:hypothetical protein
MGISAVNKLKACSEHACYMDSFTFVCVCVVFRVCNVSFII